MNAKRDIDLVNDLLSSETELAWVEFKNNNSNPTCGVTTCGVRRLQVTTTTNKIINIKITFVDIRR